MAKTKESKVTSTLAADVFWTKQIEMKRISPKDLDIFCNVCLFQNVLPLVL